MRTVTQHFDLPTQSPKGYVKPDSMDIPTATQYTDSGSHNKNNVATEILPSVEFLHQARIEELVHGRAARHTHAHDGERQGAREAHRVAQYAWDTSVCWLLC